MAQRNRFPIEVRERAVRLVLDNVGEYGSQWSAIVSISSKIGVSFPIRSTPERVTLPS